VQPLAFPAILQASPANQAGQVTSAVAGIDLERLEQAFGNRPALLEKPLPQFNYRLS
jgi:hypothetical protein